MYSYQFRLQSANIAALFFIALLLYSLQPVFGQSNNVVNNPYSQVSIASPTAGSLGKYADIPVNYHTGVPQINIPIYTVKAGPISLPISLSYHASGLKVMEPASWVGAGWALNAGGVITRTVVGAPDEAGTNNAGTESNGHFSNYGFNNYLYDISGIQDWQAFANGWKDGEPDLYFFNFGGYSGKFYFRDDRTPVIVPEQDIKIAPIFPNLGSSIQGFVITTPDGLQYSFGKTTGINATELTNPVTSQNGSSTGTAISSWYLYKITSADGLFTINLNYVQENYGYFTIAMFPVDGNALGSDAYGYNLVKNVVTGVRLSSITFPNNGSVTFVAASGARTDLSDNTPTLTDATNSGTNAAYALGAIQITDGTFCKQFKFSYGYFQDLSSPLNGIGIIGPGYTLSTDKYRLRLDSVQEMSCDNVTKVPSYKFNYFTELVPRRLTFGQDHWGFYNGVSNNDVLIPTYTAYGSNNYIKTVNGANREPAWPAMRGGALQKITYPTGGYSLFDFESNDVYVNYSHYEEVTAATFVAHEYGQSAISQMLYFTTTGGGACEIEVSNTSTNYSPTFVIKNSSNQVVYNSGLINTNYSYTITVNLPDGTYQGTLSFPAGCESTLINGADVKIYQWRTVNYSANKAVGGLRVKTITHDDGITPNDINTFYSYAYPNGQSTAVLYSRPAYIGIVRNDLIKNVGYWHPGSSGGFDPFITVNGCPSLPDASYYVSPSSVRPMGSTQGYHIGYSEVKVTQTGNGSSIYDYYGNYNGNYPWNGSTADIAITTAVTAGCDGSAPNYPPAPLPFEFLRGELKREWHYTESGTLLQDIYYTPTYTNVAVTTPGFIVVPRSNGNGVQLLGTEYDLVNARKTQMVTIKTDYLNGNSTVTTTTDTYGSAFHHQVTNHTIATSTGDNLSSVMKYAWDFRVASCDAIADGWSSYQSACSTCLTTYNNDYNACAPGSSHQQCVTTAYLNYLQCTTNARVNYVSYRKTNFTNPTNTFQINHNTVKNNNADGELKPVLELQDEYKNPVIETSGYKNGNLISASFNRFDYGMHSSAFVYPNKLQTLFPATFATTFINAATSASGTSVTKDSRYKDEALYKFDQGNPAEATGKDGITTSYLWGYNNTLPVAKAVGTDATTLQAAYSAAANNLASLRVQPSISGAQLSTYTYTPVIGMTGQTDASGKTVTYEYDKLGRLVVVRDQNGNVVKKYDYQYNGTGQ